MRYKLSLTNEALGRQFNSQFNLVNYAIKLAENLVKSGRAPHVSIEEENPAVVVLEEIAAGRDLLPMDALDDDEAEDSHLEQGKQDNQDKYQPSTEVVFEETELKVTKKSKKGAAI